MFIRLLALILVTSIPSFSSGPNNAVQSAPPNDFQARCHAKGVIQCFDFDSPDEVLRHVLPAADGRLHALIDSSVKASGAASLRFDVMPRLGANTSGSFSVRFPQEFGSGEEFYVQWRQRFDQEMATHTFQGGEGWKQAIIADGGRPLSSARSCTPDELVLQNTYHRGFPQMYHSCGFKDSQYQGLSPLVPPADFLLQDAVNCRYSNPRGPGCFRYQPNQWMTFQIHVKVGKWYVNQSGNYHRDSTVELWVAEENKPSVLVISMPDYDLVHDDASEKYGRIWFLPYNTNKNTSEDHPVAHTWYDDLIVSRNRIPDPGVATPNPPDSLSASYTQHGVDLVWRNNSNGASHVLIERCAGAIYECEASQAFSQIGTAAPHGSSFEDKSAARTKTYTYRVRAKNSAGLSAYSNPATNVPLPPSDLTAETSGGAVHLRWSDNSPDETAFVIERCEGSNCNNFTEVARVAQNQTQFSQSGLARGATYLFRVRSANPAGSWLTWDKAGVAYSNPISITLR